MDLDKNSYASDKIANLYRAALYLGLGKKKIALTFLKNSSYPTIIKNVDLSKRQKQLFWAEKILDRYHQELLELS